MKRRIFVSLFMPCIVAFGVLAACSSDDKTNPTPTTDASTTDTGSNADTGSTADTGSPVQDSGQDAGKEAGPKTGTISAVLTYTGAQTGSLSIGYFTSPTAPPIDGQRIAGPITFPKTVTFTNVNPGTYILFAYLDVNNNNLAGPGPEDPTSDGAPKAVVTAGATATVNMNISDPDGGP